MWSWGALWWLTGRTGEDTVSREVLVLRAWTLSPTPSQAQEKKGPWEGSLEGGPEGLFGEGAHGSINQALFSSWVTHKLPEAGSPLFRDTGVVRSLKICRM